MAQPVYAATTFPLGLPNLLDFAVVEDEVGIVVNIVAKEVITGGD